ncbi:hypothetical protein M758_1G140900 [Ceratodon purpureus]|nr:hypothetical protein M758_1G140900 [Ceratodon purpureus]KAG0629938.1 hypothetical protein M758_1G140900 [Ceratodon purpureus]
MAMAMALVAPGLQCGGCAAFVSNSARGRLQLKKSFARIVLSPSNSRVHCSVGTETQVQTLWSWAQAQGVQGESIRPSEVTEGLGLLAQRPVGQGDEILSVPETVWINLATVQKSSLGKVTEGLKSWVAIALFLIHETSNSNSKWRPYLDTLPKNLDSPLFWSDEELAELQGTQLLGSVVGYLEFLENEYNKVVEEIMERNTDLFDPAVFTFDAFRWAFGILRSRSFAPLTGEELALVPVADLMNHGVGLDDKNPSWLKKSSGGQIWNIGKSSSNVLTVRASANFQSGEQILMQYGSAKSNADLALDYGFVEPNTESQFGGGIERDSLALSLEISPEDRFIDDKADILEINGFQCSMQFDLPRGQGPSDEMITFLRLSALSGPDSFLLEALFRNEAWGHVSLPVSRDNEEGICTSMLEGLRAALDGYSTTIEEDLEILGQEDLSVRKEIAVVVRLGEKRVMQELQTWFEARLEELDSLEYYAERRLRNLGLMDDGGYMTPWVFNE